MKRVTPKVAFLVLLQASCSNSSNSQQPKESQTRNDIPSSNTTSSASAQPVASASTERDVHTLAPRSIPDWKVTKVHQEKQHSWRQIDEVNWQAIADQEAPLPAESYKDSQSCPTGMLRIRGGFLVDTRGKEDSDEVQLAQNESCLFWKTEDRSVNGLCDRFDKEKWTQLQQKFPRKPMDFCIDRYEYPNVYGQYPLVVTTFSESQARCAKENKRLCTESEWTFACEGEEALPYPYGYERDQTVCNIGVMGPGPGKDTFKPRTTETTAHGIDFSWRGKRAGESPKCSSVFGVEDLTGNVDEWTQSVRRYGYQMIMKGGHWGPARQRCRPQTRGHGPYYVRYDQGFRCCQDAK